MKNLYNKQDLMFRRNQTAPQSRSQSYLKKVVEQNTSSRIKQGFMNMTTNVSYKIGGGLHKMKDLFSFGSDKNKVIYLHGKKLANQQEARAYIRKVIWFSYRKIPGLAKNVNCDTGWGCLIRVGQMALASGLKLHLQSSLGQKQKVHQQVIMAFVENGGKNQKYSLKKIVECAKEKDQSMTYGSWFKVPQICEALVTLHFRNPMKNAENLQLIHFQGQLIYIETILKKLSIPACKCAKKRIQCTACGVTQKQQIKKQSAQEQKIEYYDPRKQKSQLNYLARSQNKATNLINSISSSVATKATTSQKKALLFVSGRYGFQNITPDGFQQIKELLSLQCSLGMIGGVPKKGFYFVGYSGDELIYLDPHLVQSQLSMAKLQLLIRTFESDQLRKVKRLDIDPSLAFVFYIDSLKTLSTLQKKLQDMGKTYDNNPLMYIQWKNQNPCLQQQQQKRISKIQQEGSQFDDLENSFIDDGQQ